MKVYWFIKRKGKEYARENFYRPDAVHHDFNMWNLLTGRDDVYIEKARMEDYISTIIKHLLFTSNRYEKFKKDHQITDEIMYKKLGYKHMNSFLASVFKWKRIEAFMNEFEELHQLS